MESEDRGTRAGPFIDGENCAQIKRLLKVLAVKISLSEVEDNWSAFEEPSVLMPRGESTRAEVRRGIRTRLLQKLGNHTPENRTHFQALLR